MRISDSKFEDREFAQRFAAKLSGWEVRVENEDDIVDGKVQCLTFKGSLLPGAPPRTASPQISLPWQHLGAYLAYCGRMLTASMR